jgi:hypothetical protein
VLEIKLVLYHCVLRFEELVDFDADIAHYIVAALLDTGADRLGDMLLASPR